MLYVVYVLRILVNFMDFISKWLAVYHDFQVLVIILRVNCNYFVFLFSVSSQCAGSEVKPLTEDRGCDSVLLGQSDRTPHGAVIDEYGAMVEWYFAGETEVLGENLPSATLSTTNPTWIDPGANPGLRGERSATNRLSHGTTKQSYLLQYTNFILFCFISE
jgi:hypothetical protein